MFLHAHPGAFWRRVCRAGRGSWVVGKAGEGFESCATRGRKSQCQAHRPPRGHARADAPCVSVSVFMRRWSRAQARASSLRCRRRSSGIHVSSWRCCNPARASSWRCCSPSRASSLRCCSRGRRAPRVPGARKQTDKVRGGLHTKGHACGTYGDGRGADDGEEDEEERQEDGERRDRAGGHGVW